MKKYEKWEMKRCTFTSIGITRFKAFRNKNTKLYVSRILAEKKRLFEQYRFL